MNTIELEKKQAENDKESKYKPVVFAVERWHTFYPDAKSLFPFHWSEVALDKDVIPLDMDIERYAAFDEAGILHLITGRTEGRLIAYWTGLVQTHLHYKSTLHCYCDLYYISPLWRRGSIALKLFGTAHRTLKERGVVKIMSGTKIHNGLDNSRIFEFMHYTLAEKQFTKLL